MAIEPTALRIAQPWPEPLPAPTVVLARTGDVPALRALLRHVLQECTASPDGSVGIVTLTDIVYVLSDAAPDGPRDG